MAKLLSYNQRIFEPWFKNPFSLDLVNYKIVEGLEEYWGLEADIPEVVYEHAILQNVMALGMTKGVQFHQVR